MNSNDKLCEFNNIKHAQHGFSLMELMVGMLISIIGSLVIFQVFSVSEGQKRTTTTGADAQQTGSFAMYQVQRIVRNAGYGFARGQNTALLGCQVNAFRSGTKILPATALPAPFSSITTVPLSPVLIRSGGATAPDILTVIYGNAVTLGSPVLVQAAPTVTGVSLPNSVGIQKNDLLLVFEQNVTACNIVQANGTLGAVVAPDVVGVLPSNPLTLGGTYNATSLPTYSSNANILDLGNSGASNRPAFQLLGVNSSNQLVSYDLLNLDGVGTPSALPVADNIVNFKAAYGVDTAGADNVVDAWVLPTGTMSAASLSNGTPAAATSISQIKAIRLAIVARSTMRENQTVSPANWSLFSDTPGITITGTLTTEEQHYRYYVYDVVIPVRNSLI